jgi:DDE domain
LVAKWSARALHQDHQRDGLEGHEHHQLGIVDERDGLSLRGHYLGEGGASAQGGEIELKRIVAHYLPVGRDMLDECGLRRRKISYAGYRFPPEVIHQAIWLYLRFTLSFRDVEDLLAERGIAVSYETVRRWVNHFGPMIAAHLRERRPKPHATWHLEEIYLKIVGRMVYPLRAVDAEGEVLEVLVQSKRNKHAALKLMRKLLKNIPSPRSGW